MEKLTVQEIKTVEPGRHTGTIIGVTDRKSGEYDYVDIEIVVDDTDGMSLKLSAPKKISVKNGDPISKLAKILSVCGVELEGEVDIEAVNGKKVEFISSEDVKTTGTYSVIDEKTLKLVE